MPYFLAYFITTLFSDSVRALYKDEFKRNSFATMFWKRNNLPKREMVGFMPNYAKSIYYICYDCGKVGKLIQTSMMSVASFK